MGFYKVRTVGASTNRILGHPPIPTLTPTPTPHNIVCGVGFNFLLTLDMLVIDIYYY